MIAPSHRRHAPSRFPLILRTSCILLGTLSSLACGGPSVQFDPAPAPAWTQDNPSGVGARNIVAIGSSPATMHAINDVELATRDAKNKVAQLFDSQVKAQSSDWTLASVGGAEDAERTVLAQSVEIRSNVKVEDVTVDSKYRDEATRTQYVRIAVNRGAWTKRLQGRLADGLQAIEAHVAAGEAAAQSKDTLRALEETLAGVAKGRAIEPDVVVMDLLAKDRGVRKQLLALKERLDATRRQLRDTHRVSIRVSGPKEATKRVVDDVTKFLGTYGFTVAAGGKGSLTIRVKIGTKFLKTEKVADRTEQIYAAIGELAVENNKGAGAPKLAITLGADRYQERDTDKKAASKKAETLAAETLAARFRSAFRKEYPLD